MAVSGVVEVRVLRQVVKKEILAERISMLTDDAPRMLGKKAQELGITTEEFVAIMQPIIMEIIYEIKENFRITFSV